MSLLSSLCLCLAAQSVPELPPWVAEGIPEDYEQALVRLETAFTAAGAQQVQRLAVPPIGEEEKTQLRSWILQGLARADVRGLRAQKLADRQVQLIGRLGPGDDLVAVLPGRAGAGARRMILAAPLGVPSVPLGFLDGWGSSRQLADLCAYFRDHPIDHDLVFVVCGGSAMGHRGAHHYAASLTAEEVALTDVALSLQGLGSSPLHAWVDGSDQGALLVAAEVAERTSIPVEMRKFVDLDRPGGITVALADRAVPGLALDGIADAHAPLLQTERDRGRLLDPLQWERSVRYVQALVSEIDAWDQPVALEPALGRYGLDEDELATRLVWTRYRVMGPKGPQVVDEEKTAEKPSSKDEVETESPSEARSGRSRPAAERSEEEKQP